MSRLGSNPKGPSAASSRLMLALLAPSRFRCCLYSSSFAVVKYHPKFPPSYHLKLPPRLNPVRLRKCEKGHPGLATLYRTSNFHSLDGVSSLGLSRPALSFSLSRKLSPLMLIVIEWCSRRSRIALAITVSPKTSPQAPRL